MELFKRVVTTVLAALVLTSCSSMNSAITIGDKEFSTSDIQKPVDEVLRDRKKLIPHRCNYQDLMNYLEIRFSSL